MRVEYEQVTAELCRLKEDILATEVSLKTMRSRRRALEARLRSAFLPERIRVYEEKHPEAARWAIERLVRIGESLEEWIDRVGRNMQGFSAKISQEEKARWLARTYKERMHPTCATNNVYLRWLFKVGDARVEGTEAYQTKDEADTVHRRRPTWAQVTEAALAILKEVSE